jgi:hypothetical protein
MRYVGHGGHDQASQPPLGTGMNKVRHLRHRPALTPGNGGHLAPRSLPHLT